MSSGLEVIYSLFNEDINKEYNLNKPLFKDYIKGKEYLRNNSLCDRLINILDTYEYKDITDDSIRLALLQDGKSPEETEAILTRVRASKNYNATDLALFRDNFRDCCALAYVNKASYYKDSPRDFIKAIKDYDYRGESSDVIPIIAFNEIDFSKLQEEFEQGGVTSSFDFINESYPHGKYAFNQIVAVCAAPGVGKSLFLEQEAIHFCKEGLKTHMLVLGDLDLKRVSARMVAMLARVSLTEAERNLDYYARGRVGILGDRFKLTVLPADEIVGNDYIEFALKYLQDCDVLMIDYDANFAAETDQMYSQGRSLYTGLTKLKQEDKLIMIATQPKPSYYREEHLDILAPNESSGKMQVVDMLITLGRNWNSKLPMGYIDVPKNRNGTPNLSVPYIRAENGIFVPVSDVMYASKYNERNKYGMSVEEINMENAMTVAMNEDSKNNV